MKALSVWQRWASLIMTGYKRFETRGWPAPYSIRDQRIAIASTKSVRREQRTAAADETFRRFYSKVGLSDLRELPFGFILGTVVIEGCREIDFDLMEGLAPQEEAFGIYGPDRFAWCLGEPQTLPILIPIRGGQGLWNWNADEGPSGEAGR